MNQVAFADIFQTAKRHPGKIATPLEHGKTSFHNLRTQAGQLFSVVYPSAAAIAVKLPAGLFVAMPISSLFALPLRNVGGDPFVNIEFPDQLRLVVSFVGKHAQKVRRFVTEADKTRPSYPQILLMRRDGIYIPMSCVLMF